MGNTPKLCFREKRALSRKLTCLLVIYCVPIINFRGESGKNCREKVALTKFSVLEQLSQEELPKIAQLSRFSMNKTHCYARDATQNLFKRLILLS